MKRKVIIGVALLLAITMLAACGGIPQEDYDAAVADKEAAEAKVTSLTSQLSSARSDASKATSDLSAVQSELSTAKSDLETVQSDLAAARSEASSAQSEASKANSDLVAVEATIAELEETIAELEAAAADEVVELSFEASTYTNEEYGFSVRYPSGWVETEVMRDELVRISVPASVPGFSVRVAEGGTLAETIDGLWEVFELVAESETTLLDGTPASTVTFNIFDPSSGYTVSIIATGVKKGDKWIWVGVWTVEMLSPFDEALFKEIGSTLTFE